MSKTYNIMGLVNYELAKLHLPKKGNQISLVVRSSTTSLLKGKMNVGNCMY